MKIRILTVLTLFIIGKSIAQEQRFRPGIVVGVAATDLVGIDPYDEDFHKAGFTVGGLLNTKLSSKYSFQFEILYTQKGSHQPADSTNNFVDTRLAMDYIEIPLMLKRKIKFNINKKPVDRFYFELGPSVGALVRVHEENTLGSLFDYSGFKKTEFAINIGTGCTIAKNLTFNFRFSNSIIPVIKRESTTSSYLFRYTFNKGDNMVLSFTFRYMFGKNEDGNGSDKVVKEAIPSE